MASESFAKPMVKKAAFKFRGVIVAENRDLAIQVRVKLEKICATIVEAYRVCNDDNAPVATKISKIRLIGTLGPEVTFCRDFCRSEAGACKVASVQELMRDICADVDRFTTKLLEDFSIINEDSSIYEDVFDQLMTFLQAMTAFMKAGHKVEVERVLEVHGSTSQTVAQLYNLEHPEMLLEFAQICSRKIIDLIRTVKRLVTAQNSTGLLPERLQSAQDLLQASLPDFIRSVQKKQQQPGQQSQDTAAGAYDQVSACLEEIEAIIHEVSAMFESELMETMEDYNPPGYLKDLDNSVKNVADKLAKLHAAAEDADKNNLRKSIGNLARDIVDNLGNDNIEADRGAFVQAIKQGLQPSNRNLFSAQKKLGNLMSEVTHKAQLKELELEGDVEDQKDLLGAAQDMLSALKGITFSLDAEL